MADVQQQSDGPGTRVAFGVAEETLGSARFMRTSGLLLALLQLAVGALLFFVDPIRYFEKAFCLITAAGFLLAASRAAAASLTVSAHQLAMTSRLAQIIEEQTICKGERASHKRQLPSWFSL